MRTLNKLGYPALLVMRLILSGARVLRLFGGR